MARGDPGGDICQPFNCDSRDNDELHYIWCVGGRQPKIYEVWTFGEDGITPKVIPFACVDVRAFVGDRFVTNYLT